MGSIRQFQRRAIESLRSHMVEPRHIVEPRHLTESIYALRPVISANFLLLDNRQPLRVLGISKGVGTCSDIRGMDVLVLSVDRKRQPKIEVAREEIETCAYAVLLRRATRKEAENAGFGDITVVFCVELLRITDIAIGYTNMALTGPCAYYVATV